MNTPVREHALIERLTVGLPRSALQTNRLGESDAELLRLPGSRTVLALTTDALVEEIEAGLYRDPWLIGWMTVIASASDLAAVGAEPLGVLLNQTLPRSWDDRVVDELQRGIADACRAATLPVLGGDLNQGACLHLECTAVGLLRDGHPLTRTGARPGDVLYASGPLGDGAAVAAALLHGVASADGFRPAPRLTEGQIARTVASSAIDTSDGLLPAIDELIRRSGVGCRLTVPARGLLSEQARAVADSSGLPPWVMLCGPHGEYELLFTIPARRVRAFRRRARAIGWSPLAIGRITREPGLWLATGGPAVKIDSGRVRNLFEESGGDPGEYVRALLRLYEAAPRESGRLPTKRNMGGTLGPPLRPGRRASARL